MSLSSEEKNTAYEKLTPQRKQLVDIVILFREFFDIRNIYCAALVLTDLQCFKAVVRACYRRVRADRALEKYIRFRDRFFIFGYKLH